MFNVVSPVPIRCVTDLLDRVIRAACLALGLGLGLCSPAQANEAGAPIQLTIPQVRQLAVDALQSGDFGQAIQISRGLLQADPRDPVAYFVLAMAHGSQGEMALSRKAAGYAFRYSTDPDDRFAAGQIAAQAAFIEERYSLAQVWLRRTAIHADSHAEKDIVARDYQALRRINPWSMRLNAALRPSSNVNNGSEDALQIIDGVPVTGRLNGAAQALSGLIATLDLSARYRLSASQVQATHLGARLYTRNVALSSAAQALAPNVRNSDLSQQYIEANISHRRQARGGVVGGALALGQSWYGNNPTYRFGRATLDRGWSFENGTWFAVAGSVEDRSGVRSRRYDATAYSLTFQAGGTFDNGDQFNLTLGLRDTEAVFINDVSLAASLRAAYAFDQAMGPVTMDLAVTLGYSDYPLYRSGLIVVPGGRQDKSVYADVNLTFLDWDYAGFSPSLRLRAGRTTSNDSRFQTRELSVGLGIQSKF